MIVEYSKFRELFDLPDKVDYDTFRKELRVKRNQKVMDYTLDEFIDKRDDWRGEKRDEFIERLEEGKIQTRPVWHPNHLQIPYKDCQVYNIEQAKRLAPLAYSSK